MACESLLDRLITLRKRAGFSAKDLSLRIDRPEFYIARVEKGTYPLPPAEDLEKIATACGSSMEELFSESFDTFKEDKDILVKLKGIKTKSKEVFLALLIDLYERDKNDVGTG